MKWAKETEYLIESLTDLLQTRREDVTTKVESLLDANQKLQSEIKQLKSKIALTKQMKIITLSGFDSGNPLRSLGHFNFYSSTSEYGLIENVHSIITHYLSDSIRKNV